MIKNFKHLNWLFTCVATLVLAACNGITITSLEDVKPLKSGSSNANNTNSIDSNLIFSGISSIDFKTDSTLRINWSASNLDAVSYDIYNTTSDTPVYLTTVVGQTSTSAMLTSLTPGATYKFRVRMKVINGKNDGNTNDVSVTMNLIPPAPSGLTLLAPMASPGFVNRPTIKVSGVRSGDDIKLYTDSSCLTTAIATGKATGATIDLETPVLTVVGKYNFYAKATNSAFSNSACSSATTVYSYISCPNGFVEVPGSKYLTVDAFCVMQFEARQIGGKASSLTDDADKIPWTMISQISAQAECSSLGSSHYDLISNLEWLTIAHNIESTPSNWSGNAVGIGMIPRGNTDGAGRLVIDDVTDPYIGTGNSASLGWEQKRTHTLSNGRVIWDLGGNVWEWVDWSMDSGLNPGPITCTDSSSFVELPDIPCQIDVKKYLPLNPALTSIQGIGMFSGGENGGTLRGGSSDEFEKAGIYTFDLYNLPTQEADNFGFRCVYRAEKI